MIHWNVHEFQRKALILQQNDTNMIQKASYIGLVLVLGLIIKHDSDNKGSDKGQKVMQPTEICISF